MKRFDKVKTVQLIIFIVLAVLTFYTAFFNEDLKILIAENKNVMFVCSILWFLFILSFGFLFYDFGTYSNLKREYSEMDLAIFSDPFTGMANRYSCDIYIEQYLDKPLSKDMGCMTITMTNLGDINRRLGHRAGNNAIRVFSNMLSGCSINVCFVGRNGGNKFLAVFTSTTDERMDEFYKSVKAKVDKYNMANEDSKITFAVGKALDEGFAVKDITELIALSDKRANDVAKKMEQI